MPDVNRDRAFKLIRAAFREAVNDEVAQQAIGDCVVICQYHIEDVDLWWVIELNRGKIRFHEGRVDYAGIIFNYKHAVDFHFHTLGERSKEVKWWTGFECYGNRALQKYTSPVFHAMQRAYRKLVSNETAPPPAGPRAGETFRAGERRWARQEANAGDGESYEDGGEEEAGGEEEGDEDEEVADWLASS